MTRLRYLSFDLFALAVLLPELAFFGFPARAQSDLAPTGVARITRVIDESSLIALRGNTHPLAQAQFDHGPAPDSMPAERLLLVLKRSAEQESTLETYLQAVQDPSQPSYRQWLTPEEFGKRFGVSDSDIGTVTRWLRGHAFIVSRVTASRMAIEFSGTAGQVRNTFHTGIHRYVVDGEPHWANATDPQIPSALAPVVAGIAEINDFVPRAQFVRAPSRVAEATDGSPQPNYTIGSATKGYEMYVGPADAATIYDIPNRYNAHVAGTAYDGSGVTIGIAGDSNIDVTQNAHYRATFGLPVKPLQVIVDGNDPGENGDAIEAYLDTEVSNGIAPSADVILYTAANTYVDAGLWLAILRALDDNQVDILNVSFGNCEYHLGAAGNRFVNNLWQQAAAQGISVAVSTGDSGSAGCDNPNTEWEAKYGLAVNGIASTPNDIAVGGTDFDVLYSNFPSSFTSYVDVSNKFADHRSALEYIPEEPWNDSTYPGHNTTIAENMGWGGTPYYADQTIAAGGGGVSSCSTQMPARCISGYPVPEWQTGVAANSSGRNIPDVSFLAGNGLYGASWGLCTDQDHDSSGNKIVDCAGTPTSGNRFNLTGVGGTSAAAPTFAGILALMDQKAGGRLGQADYVIYPLAKSNSSIFHSITNGNNSVTCTGKSDCARNTAGYWFMTGYNAGGSYNLAAGLGSVDAGKLLDMWNSVGFTPTSSRLTLNGGTKALGLTHGDKVSIDISVKGSGGNPTGNVALVDNLSAAKQPNSGSVGWLALADGTAKGTTDSLPGGSYKITAHYGGNGTFAASDSNSIPVTIAPEASSTVMTNRGFYDPATLKLSSTPSYGYISVIDAQPFGKSASLARPNAPATGSVAFTNGSATIANVPIASNGVAELFSATLPVGSYPLSAVYSGGPSFKPSTSAPQTIHLRRASTKMSAPYSNIDGSPTAGQPVILTTSLVNLDSDGAAPTGTVTFWDGSQNLGTAPINGVAGSPGVLASGSVSWTTTRLPAGNLNISATYEGDANYAPSPLSPTLSMQVIPAQTAIIAFDYPNAFKVNLPFQAHVSVYPVKGLPAPAGTATITIQGANSQNGYTTPPAKVVSGTAVITVPPNRFVLGSQFATVTYNGDEFYNGATTLIEVESESAGTIKPTITVIPSPTKISRLPFNISIKVTGAAGKPVPTGIVTLNQTKYGSLIWNQPLVNGEVTATLQPGALPPHFSGTFVATYFGDSNYAPASVDVTITVDE
jgi:trimeric autotransporter adhesin